MRILGLDQSLTRCGWCLLTGSRAAPLFLTGSFKSATTRAFGQELVELEAVHCPEFIVWERPVPRIFVYGKRDLAGGAITPNADQLVLPRLAGMIEMFCLTRQLPYEEVPSNTWRARVLGKGYGNKGRKEAKAAALSYARQLKIAVANEDEAEAALIALYGLSSDQYRMLEREPSYTVRFEKWNTDDGRAKTAPNTAKSGPQSSGK